MYWPFGGPQAYSAPQRPERIVEDDEGDDEAEVGKEDKEEDNVIRGLRVSRDGRVFATITTITLDIWQTMPVVLITSIRRSKKSLNSYGHNVAVLLRPDSSIAAVQTSLGFVVTYNLTFDPSSRVYQIVRTDENTRRSSFASKFARDEGQLGMREIMLSFRMVIRIDAGIGKAIALDDELVVATKKPAAVQCIRWEPDSAATQTSTELLSRLPWLEKKVSVIDVVHDRAMGLFIWITSDGRAYAVRRKSRQTSKDKTDEKDKKNEKSDGQPQGKLFGGHILHMPDAEDTIAMKAAINARFSLLAVGCANGEIYVHTARDYAGSLPLSHKLRPPEPLSVTGQIAFMAYSPDGYCLFVGFEHGWAMWSVYGKLGGTSFVCDRKVSADNRDRWLLGAYEGSWIGGGSGLLYTTPNDDRLWLLEMARSAVTGCFVPSNLSQMILQTSSNVLVYRGYDAPDIMSLLDQELLWDDVQVPSTFLQNQKPIRGAVISPDGRYLAVAGRRGLAHYSFNSGRWKTFDKNDQESAFVVRGGMVWHQHVLIAAVDTGDEDEIRLYSRELPLNDASVVFTEKLPAPAVTISPSGEDSLLVFTDDNSLLHFVINIFHTTIQLIRVGQIGLHGIIRSPARIRAMTWHLPEHQLLEGDPSQDVAHASVIFLVDGKLVLLKPALDESGSPKYDMRIIASDVEYFSLASDQASLLPSASPSPPEFEEETKQEEAKASQTLKNSLWYFDGREIHCWLDIQSLVNSVASEKLKPLIPPAVVPADFYTTSIVVDKAVMIGLESELTQRRDVPISLFRFSIRTHLFLPQILRQLLLTTTMSSAISLCNQYRHLSYFSHALEVLLHIVLEEAVDTDPAQLSSGKNTGQKLLPLTLQFLQMFPEYLDVLVRCTRKTEVRSWRKLFETLPPPRSLFEESIAQGKLQTAGGYLLVMHTLEADPDQDPENAIADPEEIKDSAEQCTRLLELAQAADQWDLCQELASFLMALDKSGELLMQAVHRMGIDPFEEPKAQEEKAEARTQQEKGAGSSHFEDDEGEKTPAPGTKDPEVEERTPTPRATYSSQTSGTQSPDYSGADDSQGSDDYFSSTASSS